MLVKYWMSPQVFSIDADASMQDAVNLMKKYTIRMLPVTRKEKLVGVLTDRDLKRASASDATTLEIHELLYLLSKIKVKDITRQIYRPQLFFENGPYVIQDMRIVKKDP